MSGLLCRHPKCTSFHRFQRVLALCRLRADLPATACHWVQLLVYTKQTPNTEAFEADIAYQVRWSGLVAVVTVAPHVVAVLMAMLSC